MNELMTCPECGFALSNKFDAYLILKEEKTQKALKDFNPHTASVNEDYQVELDDIFNQLKIPKKQWCCRIKIMTAVDFYDQMYKFGEKE